MEAAVVLANIECTKVDKKCMVKMRDLLQDHIDDMSDESEEPSPTLKSLELLMKKPLKQIIVQLKNDTGTFYAKWQIDFVQFYTQIEESGIFPYYVALDRMQGNEVDRAQMKKFETSLELFKIDLAKCKGKTKVNCLQRCLKKFKLSVADQFELTKKFGAYSHFTAYIGRAHFGLKQSRTNQKDINRSLIAFAEHEVPRGNVTFQILYSHVVYAATRARNSDTCDFEMARNLRKPLEKLHQDAIDCGRIKGDKKKKSCFDGLGNNWRKAHEKNLSAVEKLPCNAAFLRYAMESARNIISLNENLSKLLEEFSKSHLYISYATLLHHYNIMNKMTFVKKRKGTYFDACSLPILVKMRNFVTSDENHKAIQKCKAMRAGKKRETCFNAIVKDYRTEFDKMEDMVFAKNCKRLRFIENFNEFLLDLRGPLIQDADSGDEDGLIDGLIKLDAAVQTKRGKQQRTTVKG